MQLTEVAAMNGEAGAAAPNSSVAAALMLVDCPVEKGVLDGAVRALDQSADEAPGLRQRFRPALMATP